jgi:hypothetical protein
MGRAGKGGEGGFWFAGMGGKEVVGCEAREGWVVLAWWARERCGLMDIGGKAYVGCAGMGGKV